MPLRQRESSELTVNWIDLGRASLRYVDTGPRPGSGPPLVLLHEMGGTLETWDGCVPLLAGTHRVVAYDWRGAGQSEKVSASITLADHTGDLLALLDALGAGAPALLAGCAVGGAIAAAFAADHPGRTAGLVLMSPALGIRPEQREDRLRQVATFEANGLRSVVEASLAGGYPDRFRQGREAEFASFRARWLANDPESLAATYRMLIDMDTGPMLARIRCPVLAVGGEYDPLRPPDYVRGIAGQLADAAFVTAPGGHHMPHQIPEIVAGLIADFAAKIAGGN
jgi:3-oxoadipate enol-lactonase